MGTPESPLEPQHFEREDASPDALFYVAPRLLVHIDEGAIEAARQLYGELLPAGGALLDLMSSYRSHMPASLRWTRLVGVGLNAVEMAQNDQLTEHVVQDINAEPRLPFADGEFDGAVVTVSVQYLTRPVETFREVGRVLRPGAPFIVTYSNRMFPTKAVRIWRALDERDRAHLIAAYFKYAGGFGRVSARDCRAGGGSAGGDPLFGVWSRRAEA
ncbi:MAG TPA: methyltransferase domain-containing protein [Dehalococcoidia bacterium]|nr:methyltransferase domain-containing protein [Dehalococcoidia bacterium]